MGLLMALAGVLADLIALNRQLIEVALEKLAQAGVEEEQHRQPECVSLARAAGRGKG